MDKYLLFTPGPVNVAENVRSAIGKKDICHREVEFEKLLLSIEGKVLSLFEIRQKSRYRAVVVSGSGTAANEAMLSSVVGDKNILVLSNGEFGERLHATSKIHNSNTFLLEFPWGESMDMEAIDTFLQQQPIDVIAMAHHETSSGILNSLADVGALSKANGAVLVVDCVSSAGAETIDMEKNNIAFCSSSSSKAIGSYAGLSFVIGKRTEFEKLKSNPAKSAYLNLHKFYDSINRHSQTPNTPAVPLFYALEQALENILDEGVSYRHAKIRRKAELLRQGMSKLGLEFLLESQVMCSMLTTVFVPPHITVASLRQKLREHGIIIYEGKGRFSGKAFQVGNIGELTDIDIQFFLTILQDILSQKTSTAPSNVTPIFGRTLCPVVHNDNEVLVTEDSR